MEVGGSVELGEIEGKFLFFGKRTDFIGKEHSFLNFIGMIFVS